jgi:hypothetical protein
MHKYETALKGLGKQKLQRNICVSYKIKPTLVLSPQACGSGSILIIWKLEFKSFGGAKWSRVGPWTLSIEV